MLLFLKFYQYFTVPVELKFVKYILKNIFLISHACTINEIYIFYLIKIFFPGFTFPEIVLK